MNNENDIWRNSNKWGLCYCAEGHNVFFTFKQLRDELLSTEGHNNITDIKFNGNSETSMPIELLKEFVDLCRDGGLNNDEKRNSAGD